MEDQIQSESPKDIFGRRRSFIFGAVIVGLGLYSYFASSWYKRDLYKQCTTYEQELKTAGMPCPDIALEKTFVAIIIICFVFSLFEFCSLYNADENKLRGSKTWVLSYRVLGGLLLLIAGIIYIVSTVQIKNLYAPVPYTNSDLLLYFKIVVAVLALVQSAVYALIAWQFSKLKSLI